MDFFSDSMEGGLKWVCLELMGLSAGVICISICSINL